MDGYSLADSRAYMALEKASKTNQEEIRMLSLKYLRIHSIPESSSQCNSTESILKKRFCQDFIYTRKYLDFSMGFQAV